MVWKKTKTYSKSKSKKLVYSFGFLQKKVLKNRLFFWNEQFFWKSEDVWKFYEKFYRNRIEVEIPKEERIKKELEEFKENRKSIENLLPEPIDPKIFSEFPIFKKVEEDDINQHLFYDFKNLSVEQQLNQKYIDIISLKNKELKFNKLLIKFRKENHLLIKEEIEKVLLNEKLLKEEEKIPVDEILEPLDFDYPTYESIISFENFKINENDFFIKYWFNLLYKLILRDGKISRAEKILKFIFIGIQKRINNLKVFFFRIKKNMHLPIKLRSRTVAGKNISIPHILKKDQEDMLILRFIYLSSKNRDEKTLKERLLNELIDTFFKKGSSFKKKILYNKEIKECIPNMRYLKF